MSRKYLLKGPDQTYVFHTAIIGTNRRIHEETVDLCRRKNNFVCLTSRRPSRLAQKLEESGLQMLAIGPKAHGFWNVSMTITLDHVHFDGYPYLFSATQYSTSRSIPPFRTARRRKSTALQRVCRACKSFWSHSANSIVLEQLMLRAL